MMMIFVIVVYVQILVKKMVLVYVLAVLYHDKEFVAVSWVI